MAPTPTDAADALAELLAELLAAKYDKTRANGATDEQAIKACRLLWLDATVGR